ncbi:hypothetical protein YTPLAS18_14950 [Nitrospira sp.]|nr:hypothetical protein YTPLAS18_14950 [Nitrospira sp.]
MNHTSEAEVGQAKDTLSNRTDELTDVAAVKAREAASKARETARDVGHSLGEAAESLQDKIRRTGKDAADVVSSVSERVRSSATYVQEQGLEGLMDDVGTLIKRYPIQAVLIGVGVGFLLARGSRDE